MAKGNYGASPWGKWFIDVLDSYEMGARLDRGRSYANTGKVLSLDISGGKAGAKVKGHYRPFYKVEIVFPPLAEKKKVFDLIEKDPALLARIAAGELPEEFLFKLKKEGISLIPRRWDEMRRSCNCPDYGDPCKHMAALYYMLAREIDADPQVLFRLRGIDLGELAKRLGADLDHKPENPFAADLVPAEFKRGSREKGKKSPNAPEPILLESANPAGPPGTKPELAEIPHCTELILSLLPPAPVFSSRDFAVTLGEFYHQAARHSLPIMFFPTADKHMPEAASVPVDEEHLFSHSRWTVDYPDAGPGAQPELLLESLSGEKRRYDLRDAFFRFRLFSSEEGTPSYTFLYYLFKFLGLVIDAGAYIPCPVLRNDELRVIWLVFDRLPRIRETLDSIARYGSASAVKLLSSALLNEWVKEVARSRDESRQGGDRDFRNLGGLFFLGEVMDVSSPALRSLPLAISNWLMALHTDFSGGESRPGLHEGKRGPVEGSAWKYRFMLKPLKEGASFTLQAKVRHQTEKGVQWINLKDAVGKTGTIAVLRAPTVLSNYLPELRYLFRRTSAPLSEERLLHFLDSGAGLISRLGIEVVFPKSLHRELKPRLVLRTDAKKAPALVSYLDLGSLLHWQWDVAIGDEVISAGEWQTLLKQKSGVVKFRDKYIRLDGAELSRLLKNAQAAPLPGAADFLKAHFAGDTVLSFDAEGIMEKLFTEPEFPIPKSLKARLREYQERGCRWVCSLLMAGFGCILADDMGLGKTIQSIAVLLRLKEQGFLANSSANERFTGDPSLIIAPASLLENWERELARFAPSLKVGRYHGPGRRINADNEIFLTTYQTVIRDAAKLEEQNFALLIVDEAHLMKNAETRGARTIKKLRSRFRLALSGTPVENRLEDLRSLFDFILPSYLGTETQFRDEYRYPIEVLRQQEKADALRKITAPFLLRRLKTDRGIIRDLPEKITVNEYAALEKEQAALYKSIVDRAMEKSAQTDEPSGRSALILSLLTALKQVCDHPRVYDKESPARSELSGKTRLLLTLLGEILANREKVLIFSQYVETLNCLEEIIRNEMGEGPLLYHGGLSPQKRGKIIDRFQSDPVRSILLVSLKAGGLGLNLTAASRVIHYDLWYNPAVENQATDRAFRIGQKRNVFVHRFITRNSFEERIDEMLMSKRELSDMTVSSGESWLARMSHEELRALFSR
ncbi:helicase [Spirochaetia bacterium]|nr:helicase [Spirochaetia bacterium]